MKLRQTERQQCETQHELHCKQRDRRRRRGEEDVEKKRRGLTGKEEGEREGKERRKKRRKGEVGKR